MPGLNTRSFFARWRALHAASNPGLRKDRWEVDGVEWTKERHSFWGERYSFQFEVHRMAHRYGSRHGWALLVVIERWGVPTGRPACAKLIGAVVLPAPPSRYLPGCGSSKLAGKIPDCRLDRRIALCIGAAGSSIGVASPQEGFSGPRQQVC
jgi:hypothetical protein